MGRQPRTLEGLVIHSAFWLNRRVFLTGHTGFKGSWLSLMLSRLNADTTGFALAPVDGPTLYDLAGVGWTLTDMRGDIRQPDALAAAMDAASPEIVIHMAAQPLVKAGYADPVGTFASNVMGTVNLLDAVRRTPSVRSVVIVTTDKCYAEADAPNGYGEGDRLGGRDPYSASKACAELVSTAYRDSYFGAGRQVTVATARAGNVIGGGDFADDRIVPDAVRAFMGGEPLAVRNPGATRPWQHVLDPLVGYLMLAERGYADRSVGEGWNFGPRETGVRDVEALVTRFMAEWGPGARWSPDRRIHPHEAATLRLDSRKALDRLGWEPLLDFDDTVAWTARWYAAYAAGASVDGITRDQVDAFLGQRVRLTSPFRPAEEPVAAPRDAFRRTA
jgi:CDP-glucose 4,6-dehydratase